MTFSLKLENGTKYKGYVFKKIYEIIDLKTGNCLEHGYSIKDCKLRVEKELKSSLSNHSQQETQANDNMCFGRSVSKTHNPADSRKGKENGK
jgi:hypothetical protein